MHQVDNYVVYRRYNIYIYIYIYSTYQLLYTYSILPVDGLQICPKYVEVDWRNKLRINCASSWFLLHNPKVVLTEPNKGRKLRHIGANWQWMKCCVINRVITRWPDHNIPQHTHIHSSKQSALNLWRLTTTIWVVPHS